MSLVPVHVPAWLLGLLGALVVVGAGWAVSAALLEHQVRLGVVESRQEAQDKREELVRDQVIQHSARISRLEAQMEEQQATAQEGEAAAEDSQ